MSDGEEASHESGGEAEAVYTICNERGLHARASSKLVKLVEQFEARVTVSKDGMSVGGTSIMGLMLLAAGPGTEITIHAEGDDAAAVMDAIGALIADGFGEND